MHTPPTIGEIDFFGDYYHPNIEDKPLIYVNSFLKTDTTITANAIGLYFNGYEGDGANLPLVVDVTVGDTYGYDFEEPSKGPNPVVVASSVNLASILSPPVGWKWIPIEPFTFEAGKVYNVCFDVTELNTAIIPNEQTDTMIVATTNKVPDFPTIPPEYPYPWEDTKHLINAYGVERPEMGKLSNVPLAIALSEETSPPPPPPPSPLFPRLREIIERIREIIGRN